MLEETTAVQRDRRAERHEATRAEILEAAWAQVREHGLGALSLRDVAKAVGMRAPSLYSYFDSKHAIYDAMYAEGYRQFAEHSAGVEPTGDRLGDVTAGMRAFLEFCTEDPARYQLLFQRTIPGFEPSPESYAISVDQLEALRARLAEQGITDERALDLLTAISSGLADQQIANDPGGDRWLGLVDDAAQMFLAYISSAAFRERGSTA